MDITELTVFGVITIGILIKLGFFLFDFILHLFIYAFKKDKK